jgi:hypothetical protein
MATPKDMRDARVKAIARGKAAKEIQKAGKYIRAGKEVARLERQDFKDKQK